MIKGGMLKDDIDLSILNLKPGQMLMLIGTVDELPKAPPDPVTFVEDMTDSQLASATKKKVGLVNLGNTCYLNSTLQVLRAIPELQLALSDFTGQMGGADDEANLTASLRDLFKSLKDTTEPFPPLAFLSILRQVAPQFAEMQREGHGFAQQDAEEVWVRIITALQQSLKGQGSSSSNTAASVERSSRRFVEHYLTGDFTVKRSCSEALSEEPTYSNDSFRVLQCNISSSTNDMSQGIKDSLNQQIEKNSETLGRIAVYNEESRINRLPAYLTIHFVRFYWRREIGKKTKIMRKVRFPIELDVTDFLSDELKSKTRAYRDKVHGISKEREERARVRRKAKAKKDEAINSDATASTSNANAAAIFAGADTRRPFDAMAIETYKEKANAPVEKANAPVEIGKISGANLGAVIDEIEEAKLREQEAKELELLLHPDLKVDVGCNPSALYELVGVITHKGAHADGGHYISWVLKEDEAHDMGTSSSSRVSKAPVNDSPKEEWYKFDDEKVSVVSKDKITMLSGGGEDSTAYLLLYRAKRL